MDRSTDWPWSWEEEIEWKADLEDRDYDFLLELITSAVEDSTADSQYTIGSLAEQIAGEVAPEEFPVTA
jgi:hypothetical protein